jgi:hypothetical protein
MQETLLDELIAAPLELDNNMTMLSEDGKIYCRYDGDWVRAGNEPEHVVQVVMSDQGTWCFNRTGKVYRWNEQSENSQWNAKESVGLVSSSLRFESRWSNAQRLKSHRPKSLQQFSLRVIGTRIVLAASLIVALTLGAFGIIRQTDQVQNAVRAAEKQHLNISNTLLKQSYPAVQMPVH